MASGLLRWMSRVSGQTGTPNKPDTLSPKPFKSETRKPKTQQAQPYRTQLGTLVTPVQSQTQNLGEQERTMNTPRRLDLVHVSELVSQRAAVASLALIRLLALGC